MASAYGWETLECVGDFVVCRGKTAKQVSSMAKTYVERRYGTEAVVAAVTVPPGDTVVFLAYVPPKVEAPPPPPTPVEPAVKPLTKADQRRLDREARDAERARGNKAVGLSTFARLAVETAGYDDYRPERGSPRDAKVHAAGGELRSNGGSRQEVEELEAHLEATLPRDVEPVQVDDEFEDD